MKDADIDRLAAAAGDHWWYQAKLDLVEQEITRAGADRRRAVDAGCGSGHLLERLAGMGFASVVGMDASGRALTHARGNAPRAALLRAAAEQVPLASDTTMCLTSLDVIEHCDDVAAVREYTRVVRPGGIVVIAVPAYEWRWSDHDVALGHRRRYTRSSLRHVLEPAGLDVVRTTYFHSWLLVPAALIRKTPLRRLQGEASASEMSDVSPAVNKLFGRLARLERRVVRHVPLPFGLSVLAICRRR